jgi:putative flippase GtrA
MPPRPVRIALRGIDRLMAQLVPRTENLLTCELREGEQTSRQTATPVLSIQSLRALVLRNRRFILYCSLGIIAVAVEITTYWVLVNYSDLHYQLANVLATLCGILTSFCLNAAYTFGARDRLWLRALSFVAVGMFGLGLTAITLYLLVNKMHFDKTWAKAVSGYVVLAQYNLNRLVSFRQ